MLVAGFPKTVEQRAWLFDFNERPAKFAAFAFADMPAKLHHHRLLAIADTKNGQSAVKNYLRGTRGVGVCGGCRAAGQNDALWLHPRKRRLGIVERRDFGIDPGLAHTARDQLRNLASEIDDQDGVGRFAVCFGVWHGQPIVIGAPPV